MTGPLAFLFVTLAPFLDPADTPTVSVAPSAHAHVRVAWDPETGTWGAPQPSGGLGTSLDSGAALGGPELPFEAPIEFTLPGGGRGVLLGRAGLEYVTVTRGKDGRLVYRCSPEAQPAAASSSDGPTDR